MILAASLMGLGLVGLVAGGELLVRGAVRLASVAGISSLVIGLTVVAFGTSAPELAVAINASLTNQAEIAVGNVVGSNIFNVLFILGLSALISPLLVSSQLVRIDVPLMIVASFAVLGLGMDGAIGRWDGLGLFLALTVYLVWTVRQSRKEQANVQQEFQREYPAQPKATLGQLIWQVLLIVAGLALLSLGARCLVDGASDIARVLGMSELLIGLTIVAVGTSLPEVAASIMATVRGERDIAVGNVVGSNLFNLMCVLGLGSAVVPQGIPISSEALRFDIPVMVAVAVACLPIFVTGHLIARWEGALFFGYYVAYTTYLILAATRPGLSQQFGWAMLVFVVPLTVITLLVTVIRR